ncbi:MAG: nucleotidyltransferase [Clostridiales bacterium GWF2_36_10]|nr:MAG: nucleotidyltransferase [Clostridiales bacterium GWF2_36_10]HAN20069.1 nucleotidyltransferase [Clostridiales bacterium]
MKSSINLSKRFENAVNSFIEKIKDDQNIIAVIVYGSFSYDTVWEKSDIDTTVIIRDQKIETHSYCIDEDNITINVGLMQRSDFKRSLEKQLGGSIDHSVMAKGRIVYTTDESLYEYFEEYKKVGKSDMERSLFYNSNYLISYMNKAEKWIKIKNDLTYSRLYILKAADVIAQMEICKNLEIPTREAILQAEKLNPELINKFYQIPISGPLSKDELYKLINEIDKYLMDNIEPILNVVNDSMGDGEIKTVTQISNYYKCPSHFIINIFEYLYEKGFIEKLSQTIRITPKSKMAVEEIAFILI